MPTFFFDLHDDMTVVDEEGHNVPGLAEARQYAMYNAREMACAEVREGRLTLNHRIEVRDENGSAVATVRFADVIQVET